MVNFEITQLEYFVQAARSGSFSKAAHSLLVTQQALSKGIRALEGAFGVELFNRGFSGVSLTEQGMAMLDDAEEALRAIDRCKQHAALIKQERRPMIRIGILSACFEDQGGTLHTRDLTDLQRKHASVELVFKDVSISEAGQSVLANTIDIGIAPIDETEGTFSAVALAWYQTAVVMSKKNPLSLHDTVPLSSLDGGKVAFAPSDPDGRRDYLTRTLKMIQEKPMLSSLQIRPIDASRLISDDSTFVIRPMQHALRTTSTKNVAIRPLVDDEGNPVTGPLCIFWRSERILSDVEQTLVQDIVSLYRATH